MNEEIKELGNKAPENKSIENPVSFISSLEELQRKERDLFDEIEHRKKQMKGKQEESA